MSLTCRKVDTSGPQPPPRTNHAGAWWQNQLIIYGGNGSSKYTECLDDLWVLDTSTMTWSQPETSGDQPGPRCHHSVEIVGDKLWLFAGWTGKRRCNFLHSLDLSSWTWTDHTHKQSPIDTHSSHATCVLDDITMLVIGRGETGTHAKYGCNIDYLDTAKLKWTTYPGSSISRAGHTITFMPSVSSRYAYVYGGRQRHMLETVVCKVKNPRPDRFHSSLPKDIISNAKRTDVPDGRSYHSATGVNDMFIIYGGFIQGKSVRGLVDGVSEVFIFDGRINRWFIPEVKGDWPMRAAHVAARTGERMIVTFGGEHSKMQFNDVHVVSW